jgi:hypothetical protein
MFIRVQAIFVNTSQFHGYLKLKKVINGKKVK